MSGSKPRLTPEQAAQLRAEARTGVTCADLARQYGIGRTAVRNYLHGRIQAPEIVAVSPRPVYLATGRRPKLSREQVVMLRSLASGGARDPELSRRFGVTPKTVRRYLRGWQKSRLLA